MELLSMHERLLREFEENVLDQAYLTHPIWAYDKNELIYALFAAFDSFLLPFIDLPKKTIGQLQVFKNLEEGFIQALIWYNKKYGMVKPTPSSNRVLISSAGDFLTFCAKYFSIAHFHMLFNKNLCDVEVNMESRTVTFIPTPQQWDGGGGFGQGANVESTLQNRVMQSNSDAAVIAEFNDIDFSLVRGRIVFNDYSFLKKRLLINRATSIAKIEQLYLPSDLILYGFSIQEFERIMIVLEIWAFVVRTIYIALADQGTSQENCMPTQLIRADDFAGILSRYSEVEEQTVKKVVKLLTFGALKRMDIYLQPFYVADNMCLWSPFVIGKTKSKRNLLKLAARMPSSSAAIANLVGLRETAILNDLGLFFAKKGGYSYKLNIPVSFGSTAGEIDILLYNSKNPDEVLIIEAKCVLPVDDLNELYSATNEMIRAQEQIRKVCRILTQMPNADKKRLYPFVMWEKVLSYYALVVTPESYPSRNYVHDEIPATSIQILKYHLKSKDIKKPSTICSLFKKKPWAKNPTSNDLIYEEILIGDVLYRIPGVQLGG